VNYCKKNSQFKIVCNPLKIPVSYSMWQNNTSSLATNQYWRFDDEPYFVTRHQCDRQRSCRSTFCPMHCTAKKTAPAAFNYSLLYELQLLTQKLHSNSSLQKEHA